MLSNAELAALIEVGVESRAIEFKGAGSTRSKEFVALVARACIALANQRDGGTVIIGVVDDDAAGDASGLAAEEVSLWLDYDNVMAKMNAYADPPLVLTLARRTLPSGRDVVLIDVAEFALIPVLGARDFGSKITRGQLYTRSMAKPESSALHTQNEIREVLELATEKNLHAFLRTAQRGGMAVTADHVTDAESYGEEGHAFDRTAQVAPFVSAPHMFISIRPRAYSEQRLAYEKLTSIISRSSVRLRGWPMPFVQQPGHHTSFVFETYDQMHPEAWALFESGQFRAFYPLPDEFGPDITGMTGTTSGHFLPVWFPVLLISEATLLAIRLQQLTAPDQQYELHVGIVGAQGWELVAADTARRGFHRHYAFGAPSWSQHAELPAHAAVEGYRDTAAELSRQLLLRFGWQDVTTDIISGIQDTLRG